MGKEEREKHIEILSQQRKSTVPLGPYPYMQKGCGWVQLWFTGEDCKLEYTFQGWMQGLNVTVESTNKSGKVTVYGRSEVFDAKQGAMVLQIAAWKKKLSTVQAKQLILNEKRDWEKYGASMIEVQKKWEAREAKKGHVSIRWAQKSSIWKLGKTITAYQIRI